MEPYTFMSGGGGGVDILLNGELWTLFISQVTLLKGVQSVR